MSVVLSGYSASSTTKTGRHDIAEILLKMALNTKIQIHSFQKLQALINGKAVSESIS
jgi:hypothetical protein